LFDLSYIIFCSFWDFNSGGFFPPAAPKVVETRRLLFDSVSNIYKDYTSKNEETPVSKTSFFRIKKELGCFRAKGEVDGCHVCLPDKRELSAEEIFIRNQHKILVKKTCRAIRAIREHLPKGL
jgi:hypothetical protein